jgi:hypothetical protein
LASSIYLETRGSFFRVFRSPDGCPGEENKLTRFYNTLKRGRDTQTDRQRHREKQRDTERQGDRERQRDTERHRETERNRETERQRDKGTGRHREIQIDGETERQRDRETERQGGRETERYRLITAKINLLLSLRNFHIFGSLKSGKWQVLPKLPLFFRVPRSLSSPTSRAATGFHFRFGG